MPSQSWCQPLPQIQTLVSNFERINIEHKTQKVTMSPLNRNLPYYNDITEGSERSVMSTASPNEERRQVQFSVVQVREYERIIGDHPDVRVGPPLSLDWKYEERKPLPLDDYERSRISKGNYRLSSITRKNMLLHVLGISEEEILNVEKEVQRIKAQRTETARQGKAVEKRDVVMQSAKRKLRRTFSKEKLLNAMGAGSTSLMFPMMVQ
jgi:hypothetical protein